MTFEDTEVRIWQSRLYDLQREAPAPILIPCLRKLPSRPPQYGLEFHGQISRQETEKLLADAPSGAYLIRESQREPNGYTLVIWFDKSAKNYKLFYDHEKNQHYVGEKRFDTVECLVADGLIHFHIETRGAEILKKMAEARTYERTPFYKMRYHTFNSNMHSSHKGLKSHRTDHSKTARLTNTLIAENRNAAPKTPMTALASELIDNRHWSGNQRQISTEADCPSPFRTAQNHPSRTVDRHFPVSSVSDDVKVSGKGYRETPPSVPRTEFILTLPGPPSDTPDSVVGINSPTPPPRTASTAVKPVRLRFSNYQATGNVSAPDPRVTPSPFATENNRITVFNPTFVRGNPSSGLYDRTGNSGDYFARSESNNLDKQPQPTPVSATLLQPDSSSPLFNPMDSYHNDNNNNTLSTEDSPLARSERSGSVASSLWGQSGLESHQPYPIGTSSVDNNIIKEGNGGPQTPTVLELIERYHLPIAASPDTDQLSTIEFGRKKHDFKVHTFRTPRWCDFCTQFMWGLVSQGVQCADCGFQAHKRCSHQVPDDCLPDIKHMKRVFGVDLTNLTVAERKSIPTVLERCVNELERRGLDQEGIYRIPGSFDRIEDLRAAFDKNCESAQLSPARVPDVSVITSLIKSFLRQLPVPLITYEAHPKLLEIIRNDQLTNEEKLTEVASVLGTLPQSHYETLRFFLRHVHRVAENHEKNMMRAKNLAVVLTPSLMNSSYSTPNECLIGMQTEHTLTEFLISETSRLFPELTTPDSSTAARRTMVFDLEDANRPTTSPTSKVGVSPRPSLLSNSRKLWFLRNRHSVSTPLSGEFSTSPIPEREIPNDLASSFEPSV